MANGEFEYDVAVSFAGENRPTAERTNQRGRGQIPPDRRCASTCRRDCRCRASLATTS